MKKWAEKLIRWRVRINTFFFILAFFSAHYSPNWWWAGLCTAMCGVFFRLWASGFIEKDKKLAVRGPYAMVRHPLYLGSFLIFAGIAIGGKLLILGCVFLPLFLLTHVLSALKEEEKLKSLFGKEYEKYASEVPFLFPRFATFSRLKGWNPELVKKNREAKLLGVVLIYFLWVRIKGAFVSNF